MSADTVTTKPFDPAREPDLGDEYGFWTHPDVPDFEGTEEVRAACAAMGFECSFEEGPDDVYLGDSSYDTEKVLSWQPAKSGWQLVSKYDTEDGPWAMFVRPLVQPESATAPPAQGQLHVWDQGSGDTTVFHIMRGREVLATIGGGDNLAGVQRLVKLYNEAVASPTVGNWTAVDDINRLVRAMDVAYNGEKNAAPQAALCDIAGQICNDAREYKRPIREEIALRLKLNREFSSIIHDAVVANQAAYIEWRHGKGAEGGMQWVENGLAGPGHIPREHAPYGKEAQAYFDANKSDRFPTCYCGRPSNILHMGSGYCCDAHYEKGKSEAPTSMPTAETPQ